MSSSYVPATSKPRRKEPATTPPTTSDARRAARSSDDLVRDPHAVLTASSTAGNAAVSRQLTADRNAPSTAPVKPASTVLSADAILTSVGASTYLEGQLDASSRGQQRAAGKAVPATVRDRVQAQLARFEAMFSGHDGTTASAMKLALAMDAIASNLAEQLYDPTLQPTIATQLLRVYGPKIARSMSKRTAGSNGDAAVALAKVLVAKDPVAQYLHKDMRLDQAALEVTDLATAAGKPPLEMFTLLSERYQAQIGSYSYAEVEAEQDTREAYTLREAFGQLSRDYYTYLFGTAASTDGAKQQPAPVKNGDPTGGLAFTTEAQARLDKLRDAVKDAKGAPLPSSAKDRLAEHLADVHAQDQAIATGRTARVRTELLKLGADASKVDAIIAALHKGLPDLPLTITVPGVRWFGSDAKGRAKEVRPTYTAATGNQKQRSAAEGIGKRGTKAKKALKGETIDYPGQYDDPRYGTERGDTYLEFRRWKDQRMTGNLGFAAEELPVYGAANVNWETTRGTEAVKISARQLDLQDKARKARTEGGPALTKAEVAELAELKAEDARMQQVQARGEDVGINYYGDTHFVLDPATVRDRVVYTATDHGQPHKDPFLAFADFLLPNSPTEQYGGETYRADITGLKPAGVTNKDVVADVINAILNPTAPAVRRGLPFEIQIFGGIDLRRDVTEIHVSPGAPAEVFANATAWAQAKARNVKVQKVALQPGTAFVKNSTAEDLAKQALQSYA